MRNLDDRVMNIFGEISEVPRKSGNRDPMKNWLLNWAGERGLNASVDDELNIVIQVPPSAGREHEAPIGLQAHTDMVCVAEEGKVHDFSAEPIRLIREGDWLTAEGTSLGADNGIGLAIALACADEPELSRPPLEIVATVDEEIGLLGAFGLDTSMVRSRRMINLDGETEGDVVIGCAGVHGRGVSLDVETVPAGQGRAVRLSISGFQGGHSAADVDKGRGNAIVEMVRGLLDIIDRIPFNLVSLCGGTAFNAIPGSAEAVIFLTETDLQQLEEYWRILESNLKSGYGGNEPHLQCLMEDTAPPQKVLSLESALRVLRFLNSVPNGLLAVDRRDPSIPETSSNLGVVEAAPTGVKARILIRSSNDSRKAEVVQDLEAAIARAGGSTFRQVDETAWQSDSGSAFRTAYLDVLKGKGREKVIHGGVECGVLATRIPGLDVFAIGPDIEDLHSPAERVNIRSVERLCTSLQTLLSVETGASISPG